MNETPRNPVEVVDMQPPTEIDVDKVQYWSEHARQLAKSQQSKALKLVEFDCIRYIGGTGIFQEKHAFISLPLNTTDRVVHNGIIHTKIPYTTDYNRKNTAYELFKTETFDSFGNKTGDLWTCNCQGWDKARRDREEKGQPMNDGVLCCHLTALFYCFKMKRFTRKEGVTDREARPDFPKGEVKIK